MTPPWTERGGPRQRDLERFFELSPHLVCIRGTDGYLKQFNPAFRGVLGLSEDRLLSDPVRMHLHPDDADVCERALAAAGEGTTVAFEDRWRSADGDYRRISWRATPYRTEGLIYAVGRDVTEERAHEERLRSALALADEANRAKSEFLANMSHEIRTPMNGVIGMTELALETNLSDQQREYLQMVRSSAGALLDTINSILDFSKIEAGKMELEAIDFTLWETVSGALKPLALAARNKRVELLYEEAPDVPERLRGDPGRVRQALVNLVGNAVKFTHEGSVRVSVRPLPSEEGSVRLRFEVADTGIGIASDKLTTIMRPFHQADGTMTRRFGGTGLGLAITNALIGMMGGELTVRSVEGEGSTFAFTARFEESQEGETRGAAASDSLVGLHALVVDDHEANRMILAETLRRLGMGVITAGSGPEALAALEVARRNGVPIQLVLLECRMSGMDGFALAERIRADGRYSNVVLVAFTAAGSPGDGVRCQELGIASYLLKPLAPAELRDALRMTLLSDRQAGQGKPTLVTRHSLREARSPLNVLLVEDNRVNQRLALHLLEHFGHEAQLAVNGREALEAWEGGSFDVILMDIQMPEMDGLEATRRIRAREAERDDGSRIPIVALTAHAMVGDRDRFLAAGMDDYVSKPISKERLRAVLRGVEREHRSELRAAEEVEPRDPTDDEDGPARSSEPDRPPSFDRSVLLARTESDAELIRSLVSIFGSDRVTLLADIETALDAGDASALERAAHTMKGALGVFAAEPARARAERMERMGRDGVVTEARDDYEELSRELDHLERDLHSLLAEL